MCLSEPNPVLGEEPEQQQSNQDSDDKMEEDDGSAQREGDAEDNSNIVLQRSPRCQRSEKIIT